MSDDTRPPAGVDEHHGGSETTDSIAVLRAEVTALRLRLEGEVRTHRVVVIDEAGIARVRISTSADGASQIDLLDADGFGRIGISAAPERGAVSITSRGSGGQPTRVDVFALDPDEPDAAYVGVELIDRGTSVAGVALYEGRPPRTWTATP